MSPTINIGRRMPVEALAPKTNTIIATIMTLMPLIPDFERPRIKLAAKRVNQSVGESWESTAQYSKAS